MKKNMGPEITDEDAPLVQRCLKGDQTAFEVLVERHQKHMYSIAYRMLEDYKDAADVVQEAFLAAYRALGTFRAEARFATWLTSILMNQSRNRLKQRAARARREVNAVACNGMDCAPAGEAACACANAETLLAGQDVEIRVQHCIGGLEDEQREVLILRDISEYSYSDIVEMLNLPEGTVKSRLFRARTALKDCLKKLQGDNV